MFSIRQVRFFCVSIIVLFGIPINLYAEIFRCTDSDGHVVFTQKSCASTQSGEKVNMEGLNDRGDMVRPDAAVCKDVEKLANLIFPHIHQTDSILDIYTDLGGRKNLSAGITAAVNYVFNFHYNPKARQSNVASLTYAKCMDGGFGRMTARDIPEWGNIRYVKEQRKRDREKAGTNSAHNEQDARQCDDYQAKLVQLRQRLAAAKDKGERLQVRVDLEYMTQQYRDKCAASPSGR